MRMLSPMVLFLVTFSILAGDGTKVLIHARRQTANDLTILAGMGLPGVHETSASLLIEGEESTWRCCGSSGSPSPFWIAMPILLIIGRSGYGLIRTR